MAVIEELTAADVRQLINESETVRVEFKIRPPLSSNPLVSGSRRVEILAECLQTGGFFVCHEQAVGGGAACCQGFFEVGQWLGVAVV